MSKSENKNSISRKSKEAKALSKTIARQNDVFLDFCADLISMTLNTMAELGADVNLSDEELNAKAAELLGAGKQALSDQAKVAGGEAPTAVTGDQQSDAAYAQATDNSMANAVSMQHQQQVTGQAATTMLISTIITLGTAEIGKNLSNKSQ